MILKNIKQSKDIFYFIKNNCKQLLQPYFQYSNKSLIMNDKIDASKLSQKDLQKLLQQANRAKRKKVADKNYVPGTVFLQVLGSGSRGAPSSLYVSTDHSKYLFNCGEGTQRLAHEHHLKLGKLDHVFFTTPTWKNMGGLPGMSLTIQDCGVTNINLHGPKGIIELFDATKKFVLLKDLTVKEVDCSDNQEFRDSCMTIKYVNLHKNYNNDSGNDSDATIDADDTDYYGHEVNKYGKREIQTRNLPSKYQKLENENSIVDKIRGCLVYICKLHSKPGGINLQKLVEFGIKPGPVCALLKSGENVTLPDGKFVKSSDVCDPELPGPVFIVLEIPDEEYLDSLIANEIFHDYQSTGKLENQANFIIHFTPESVLRTKKYRDWMKRFSSKTENIIINENNDCYNYEALHRIQHQLTLLNSKIFPMLHDKNFDDELPGDINRIFTEDNLKIHRAKTLNCLHLRPLYGLDSSIVVKVDREADVKEVFDIEGFDETLEKLKLNIEKQNNLNKNEFPKLLVLGTGSCIPNKVRNTSGLLLRIDEDTSIIMDCGEGTVGQLIRFFGPKEIDRVLASIKAIYVSHLHADHHLGLLGILQERQRVTENPIYLFAPKQIEYWLQFYHRKFEKIKDTFNLVPNQCLMMDHRKMLPDVDDEINEALKIKDISTVEVNHCNHAFGLAVVLHDGQKIVYSGDTQPCTSLVDLGKDCDLLIHEATMEDNLEEEARRKRHSTISQAIKVGDDMNAKFTLLTHFSQRYSKMPRLENSLNKFNLNNIGIGFDNMQISLNELSLLPLFYPCLGIMFSEFCLTLEKKAEQRLKKEQKEGKI